MKTIFAVAIFAFASVLAINARSLEKDETGLVLQVLTRENIVCIRDNLREVGENQPETVDWISRADVVLVNLNASLDACNGFRACEAYAHATALYRYAALHRELLENEALAAAVVPAINSCLREEEESTSKITKNFNDGTGLALQILTRENIACLRESLRALAIENPEFADWISRVQVILADLNTELLDCDGYRICEAYAHARALYRYRALHRELLENDALAAAVVSAVNACLRPEEEITSTIIKGFNDETGLTLQVLTRENIVCIRANLREVAENQPETADWISRADVILVNLDTGLDACNGFRACEGYAHATALYRYASLHRELLENDALAAAVVPAINACLRPEEELFHY